MTVRVLLVDDQHLVRIGFTVMIEGEDDLEVAGQAPRRTRPYDRRR